MNNRAIKILFMIDEIIPGGTEKQTVLLANSLPRESFEPVIGVLKTSEYQTNLNLRTPVIDFNWDGRFFFNKLSSVWRIRRYIDKNRFDIVQTNCTESAIYGTLAVRLCRYRPYLIGTRRNLYHWVDDEPWLFRVYRLCGRMTDRILVNSRCAGAKSMEIEGIGANKITLIPNGVEVQKFAKVSQKEAQSKIGLNGKFPVIGVVANWRPIKGLVSFLKAAALTMRSYPSAHFVLSGFGPQKDELVSLAHELGLDDNILFIENSSNINEIIPAFDVAVQPSLSESFSNVLIEYMAAARPVVATRVGDAEMVIQHGTDGLLVQPDNPEELAAGILYFCNNLEKASIMGQIAVEKVVKNWSIEKILQEYRFFYEGLKQDLPARN